MKIYNNELLEIKKIVEEVIYDNIMLQFEIARLRRSLEELKSLERWWKGDDIKREGGYKN